MSTVLVRVAPVTEPTPADWAVLDREEIDRARRHTDPRAFVTAHATLRRLTGRHLGCPPEEVRLHHDCRTCGSTRHGRIVLTGHPVVHVSLSSTPHLVLVGLTEAGALGVDLEVVRATGFDGFSEVALGQGERPALDGLVGDELLRARATVWARKEAILKATGHGLVLDPVRVLVSGPGDPPRLTGWTALEDRPLVSLVDVPMAEVSLPTEGSLTTEEHVAAVAVLASGAVELVQA